MNLLLLLVISISIGVSQAPMPKPCVERNPEECLKEPPPLDKKCYLCANDECEEGIPLVYNNLIEEPSSLFAELICTASTADSMFIPKIESIEPNASVRDVGRAFELRVRFADLIQFAPFSVVDVGEGRYRLNESHANAIKVNSSDVEVGMGKLMHNDEDGAIKLPSDQTGWEPLHFDDITFQFIVSSSLSPLNFEVIFNSEPPPSPTSAPAPPPLPSTLLVDTYGNRYPKITKFYSSYDCDGGHFDGMTCPVGAGCVVCGGGGECAPGIDCSSQDYFINFNCQVNSLAESCNTCVCGDTGNYLLECNDAKDTLLSATRCDFSQAFVKNSRNSSTMFECHSSDQGYSSFCGRRSQLSPVQGSNDKFYLDVCMDGFVCEFDHAATASTDGVEVDGTVSKTISAYLVDDDCIYDDIDSCELKKGQDGQLITVGRILVQIPTVQQCVLGGDSNDLEPRVYYRIGKSSDSIMTPLYATAVDGDFSGGCNDALKTIAYVMLAVCMFALACAAIFFVFYKRRRQQERVKKLSATKSTLTTTASDVSIRSVATTTSGASKRRSGSPALDNYAAPPTTAASMSSSSTADRESSSAVTVLINNNSHNRSSKRRSRRTSGNLKMHQQRASIRVDNKFRIDPHELEKGSMIGEGSFGRVYLGVWREIAVAIKELSGSVLSNESARDDFLREAKGMSELRPHAHCVTLYGVQFEPCLAIVTEYCARGSLDAILYQQPNGGDERQLARGFLSPIEFRKILLGIAKGCAHLHAEKVIHRDLAARNVLLTEELDAKLADYGMARPDQSGDPASGNKTMTTVGPLRWQSPEQLEEQLYSTASDCWAFGVVCYEMIVAKLPWHGLSNAKCAQAVLNGEHLQIPEHLLDPTPQVVVDVMEECFAFKPQDRVRMTSVVKRFAKVWKANGDLKGGGGGGEVVVNRTSTSLSAIESQQSLSPPQQQGNYSAPPLKVSEAPSGSSVVGTEVVDEELSKVYENPPPKVESKQPTVEMEYDSLPAELRNLPKKQ